MVKQFHLLDAQTCFLRVGFRWSVETWQNKRRILHPGHELNPTDYFFFLLIPSSNASRGMKMERLCVTRETFMHLTLPSAGLRTLGR